MKILVLGKNGLAGSHILKILQTEGMNPIGLGREDLDLLDTKGVHDKFQNLKPDAVILAASKVGGMMANSTFPAEFLMHNLIIQNNVIGASYKTDVEKLIFFGSSCIYPGRSPQPIKEEYLLTGTLEKTNEAYAIAKIAGLKLIEAFVNEYGRTWFTIMPTNLYGPGDNFDLENSHVLAAVIRKFLEAKLLKLNQIGFWGSGKPRREFMFIEDFARAVVFLLKNYKESAPINIGTGKDISIKELVSMVSQISNFKGEISWDTQKPDGTFQKLLDVSKLEKMGWKPRVNLDEGLKITYDWLDKNYNSARRQVPISKL